MTRFHDVRPLRTAEDYETARKAIRPYFDKEPEAGSPEADHFDLLAMVIERYDDEHFPIPDADPVSAVQVVTAANG